MLSFFLLVARQEGVGEGVIQASAARPEQHRETAGETQRKPRPNNRRKTDDGSAAAVETSNV